MLVGPMSLYLLRFKDMRAADDFRADVLETIHSSKTALEADSPLVRLLWSASTEPWF